MKESSATIATVHGGRYLRQLCKHWGHRLEVEQGEDRARVKLPGAILTMTADLTVLHVQLEADDVNSIEAMKEVVGSHLDRFAFREAPFAFDWKDRYSGSRDHGSAESVHRA